MPWQHLSVPVQPSGLMPHGTGQLVTPSTQPLSQQMPEQHCPRQSVSVGFGQQVVPPMQNSPAAQAIEPQHCSPVRQLLSQQTSPESQQLGKLGQG